MQRKGWLILLASLVVSCTHTGPAITGCVVDVKNQAFQCVTYPKAKSVVPFSKGLKLECASPGDVEDMLKACKNHEILQVTYCTLDSDLKGFTCKPPSGPSFFLDVNNGDNYFCMSDQDRKRTLERCKSATTAEINEFLSAM